MGRHGPKNKHQKDTCSVRIGLHAQNMLTILVPIMNMFGWTNITSTSLISTRIFIFSMNKKLIRASKIMRQMTPCTI